MNKADLVNAVALDTGMTKIDTEKAVKSVFNAISAKLAEGESVQLIGFGTFSVSNRSERMGRNPQSGEPMKIEAKTVAKFKPGKALSEMVNKPKKTKAAKKKKKK